MAERADERVVGAARMLIVDDERPFGDFVKRIACRLGYETIVTTEAQAFKNAYVQARPSLVVLDLLMPDQDGIDLLRWLASQKCTGRILISSGVGNRVIEAARRVGLERGLDIAGTIVKPVRGSELRKILAGLLPRHPQSLGKTDLERALDQRELFVVYQPKVHLATGRLQGVEALVRWRHPTLGDLAPDRFLSLAEASGLIDALFHFVLNEALRQQYAWAISGIDVQMAINLSPLNMYDEGLADEIAARCREFGVATRRVTIEVTESAAMSDSLQALDILTRLRLKGFEVAIDDFGTGFSSLTRLRRLPVTELKVDRSFVRECLDAKDALGIVKTVLELARNLELAPVAEGLETPEQYRKLVELGCDFGQGYVISYPLLAESLSAWEAQWRMPDVYGEAASP